MEITKDNWLGWETVRLLGRGSFGAVYEIQRDVFGDVEKAALKVITIPQNESDIDELYSEGYDDESITSTFQNHLKSIVAEYSLMQKMDGSANVVNCKDIRYIQHDDGIGWDIYIRMELLTPLMKALPIDVSEDTVIQIGKDICNALVLCKKHEIVHRDIKPQNIFVSPNGDYKLGDFGIAKTVEKTMGGTKIGTYKYMAPEVYNNQPYGSAADIYSLGLVLYWLLNERRMPFLPLPPAKLKAGMDEDARHRRLSGENIPAPAHGSEALKRIVLKACGYTPSARYSSAQAMLDDLNSLSGSAEAVSSSEKVVIPPTESEEEARTTGPVFTRDTKKITAEDLTETTVDPRFSLKNETLKDTSKENEPVFGRPCAGENRAQALIQEKSVSIFSLIALWILSAVLSVFVLIDIPRYVPHIHSACAPWVYISLFTSWIIPLLAVVSLWASFRKRSLKIVKTITRAAVLIQLFLVACILLLTFVPVSITELYRIVPGAIYLEETFWMIGSHLNEWMPFVICLLALLASVAKDLIALSVISKSDDVSSDIQASSQSAQNNVGSETNGRSRKAYTLGHLLIVFVAILLIAVLFLRSCKTEGNGGSVNNNGTVQDGESSNSGNQVLEFQSPETEKKIRTLLGIPEAQTIYLSDVEHIERICFVNDAVIVNEWNEFFASGGYGYWDSQGKEYLVEHDGNWQYTNKICIDLQDMKLLPNLKEIVVNNAEIENLQVLSSCSGLKVLVFNYCQEVDLNEISRWQNVETLTIGGCNNLTAHSLSNVNNIRTLSIYDTYFNDFDQLANLPEMTDLSLGLGVTVGGSSNSISVEELAPDLSFLENMPNLTSLSITSGGGIEDLSPLSKLTKLRKLELTYFTSVSDISPIGNLKNLEELRFVQMGDVDYSVIESLTNLKVLDLTLCQFDSISFISSLTNLTTLKLPQTGVRDITPLSGLTQLTELDIRDANTNDLTPIKSLPLTYLVVSNDLRAQAKELFPNATIMG